MRSGDIFPSAPAVQPERPSQGPPAAADGGRTTPGRIKGRRHWILLSGSFASLPSQRPGIQHPQPVGREDQFRLQAGDAAGGHEEVQNHVPRHRQADRPPPESPAASAGRYSRSGCRRGPAGPQSPAARTPGPRSPPREAASPRRKIRPGPGPGQRTPPRRPVLKTTCPRGTAKPSIRGEMPSRFSQVSRLVDSAAEEDAVERAMR